jgi:predicted amidophosphoribosyltransferase
MIDIEPTLCKNCGKKIPDNREFCYICDTVLNGADHATPKNLDELLEKFLKESINTSILQDYEFEDVQSFFHM